MRFRDLFPEAAAITADFKTVNIAMPDITLRVDLDGVIREANAANSVSAEAIDLWVGRPWVETVGEFGSDAVQRIMADVRANGVSDFRRITQRFPSGLELPMEYNAVKLGPKAGLMVVGRNLAAVTDVRTRLIAVQQAREQDAWKLRELETRHRAMAESDDEPSLLLRLSDLAILEANPAAIRAGAVDSGRDFPAVVSPQGRTAFRGMMEKLATHGRTPGILLHIGAASTPWLVRASLVAVEPEPVVLLQFAPIAGTLASPPKDADSLEALIERLPDGFALVDAAGIVVRTNRAFLDLVQGAVPAQVIGQPISRWLSHPGADAAVLLANVRRHRVLRGFTTKLHGELGTEAEVEISAVVDGNLPDRPIGLVLRDVSRRATVESRVTTPAERLLAPLAKLTEQIGQTPLLQLVRDISDLVERHCIDLALERVDGNRSAAAELLGLSRQTLYAKLGRHAMFADTGE